MTPPQLQFGTPEVVEKMRFSCSAFFYHFECLEIMKKLMGRQGLFKLILSKFNIPINTSK